MPDDMRTDPVLDNLLGNMPEGFDCTPEHDAYIRREVQKALEAKAKNGTAGYTDLRKIMTEFGFDAY